MKRWIPLTLLLGLCPLAVIAQDQEPAVVVDEVEPEELQAEDGFEDFDEDEDAARAQQRERAEQLQRLLADLRGREALGQADRDEIEERLRALLLERKIDEQLGNLFDGDEPDHPIPWPGRPGAVVVQGRPLEVEAYEDALADTPRADVLAMLNHKDFAVRESAEAHLLADNSLDRAALRRLLTEAESGEQRHRLVRIAEHHVMRAVREQTFGQPAEAGVDAPLDRLVPRPTAAVGFSYKPLLTEDNPLTNTPAVTVTATMPGFPGHAHLRPGDLVVAVDGQTAQGIRHRELITNWLGNRIAFHKPGDTITLTVVRSGKALSIPIVCAESTALNEMYSTNGLDAAFREQPYTELWDQAHAALTDGLAEPEVLSPVQ